MAQRSRGRVSVPAQAALSGSHNKAPGFAGGYLPCGYISWRFVEQPIRFGKFKPSRRVLFLSVTAAAVVLLFAGGTVIACKGLPRRYPNEVIAIMSLEPPKMAYSDGIYFAVQLPEFRPGRCSNPGLDRPSWLLIGDSHAGHLDFGLHKVFPNVNIVRFVVYGCKPVPAGRYGESESCAEAFQRLYSEYLPRHHFDLVILSANWQPFDIPRITGALDSLNKLHQPSLLVGPIMRYDIPLRLLLADEILNHDPTLAERHRVVAFDQLDMEIAKKAELDWHEPYFSFGVLCPGGRCRVWSSNDLPLQWDETHLLDGGSVVTVQAMRNEGILNASSP